MNNKIILCVGRGGGHRLVLKKITFSDRFARRFRPYALRVRAGTYKFSRCPHNVWARTARRPNEPDRRRDAGLANANQSLGSEG